MALKTHGLNYLIRRVETIVRAGMVAEVASVNAEQSEVVVVASAQRDVGASMGRVPVQGRSAVEFTARRLKPRRGFKTQKSAFMLTVKSSVLQSSRTASNTTDTLQSAAMQHAAALNDAVRTIVMGSISGDGIIYNVELEAEDFSDPEGDPVRYAVTSKFKVWMRTHDAR